MKFTHAKELLPDHSFNRFYEERWQEFKDTFKPGLPFKFVDAENDLNWVNNEETAVFLLELNTTFGRIEPLAIAQALLRLRPDEFDYRLIAPDVYAIRLWWD